MSEVGGPQRQPRRSGAKVTRCTHEVPLVEHKELVKGEGGEVAAFVDVGVSGNDAFERPGGKKECLQVGACLGVPCHVTGLSASAAHLGPTCVDQTSLLGLHGWELRERTGPAIPWGGHHGGGAVSWAMRAFEQLSKEKGASLALVGLAGETKADKEDAAHDRREEHAFSDEGIRDM